MRHSYRVAGALFSAALMTACGSSGLSSSRSSLAGLPQSVRLPSRGSASSLASPAAYGELYSFGAAGDGKHPEAGLIAVGGALYGTTTDGGANDKGTVFSIAMDGTQKWLHSFKGTDGSYPLAGLIDVGGTLYGTTRDGGEYGKGTIFSVTPGGRQKVLYDFGHGADGAYPYAGLTNTGDTLYGTTAYGGAKGAGTVFFYYIPQPGHDYVMHSFGVGSDGRYPKAGLIARPFGKLYGTTFEGGMHDKGTVFSVSLLEPEKVLHSFAKAADGIYPLAGVIDVSDTLYGTTSMGGGVYGTVFSIKPDGTDYKLLHVFGGLPDGSYPHAGLIDVGGTLYGTTRDGGANFYGTVFRITTDGKDYKVLHGFGEGTDGKDPLAGLTDVSGTLYGTTQEGGTKAHGTIFKIGTPNR